MLLDRSLRATFANYSTLLLIAAVVFVPLQIGCSYVYRNVIATTEIHDQIREFPTESRQVKSVGKPQLERARLAFLGADVLGLLLLPLMVRAARRAQEVDSSGGVATALDAWRHIGSDGRKRSWDKGTIGTVVAATLIGLAVGFFLQQIGLLLSAPVGDDRAYVPVGLSRALARSAGVPFVLMAVNLARVAKADHQPEPKLY